MTAASLPGADDVDCAGVCAVDVAVVDAAVAPNDAVVSESKSDALLAIVDEDNEMAAFIDVDNDDSFVALVVVVVVVVKLPVDVVVGKAVGIVVFDVGVVTVGDVAVVTHIPCCVLHSHRDPLKLFMHA
jgi:hypothetical protein